MSVLWTSWSADYDYLWVADLGPPELDSIAGPKVVPPGHMCYWRAETSGMFPLDHDWTGVLDRNTGQMPQIWDEVEESGWLRLAVTDIMEKTTQDSVHVSVQVGAPKPELCWRVGDPPVGG